MESTRIETARTVGPVSDRKTSGDGRPGRGVGLQEAVGHAQCAQRQLQLRLQQRTHRLHAPGIVIDPAAVQTNILVFDIAATGMTPEDFGRIRDLFDRAMSLPVEDRREFVDRHAPSGDPIPVRLVQTNISLDQPWQKPDSEELLSDLEALSTQDTGKPALVVWPETPAPFYLNEDVEFRTHMQLIARKLGAYLLLGYIDSIGEGPSNSVAVLNPKGEVVSRYDKMHPVMFGEYIPLAKSARWHLLLYLCQPFVIPVIAVVRFLILAPVCWISRPVRDWVHRHVSSMVMDPSYIRPLPTRQVLRVIRLQEFLCLLWTAGVAAALIGPVLWAVLAHHSASVGDIA
jgi:hypothetical protein